MGVYPINLKLEGKNCAVIGGGKVALRKVASLVQAGAKVTVISPQISELLWRMAECKEICCREKYYETGDVEGFFLVICASDREDVNRRAAEEAKQRGALVNVTDESYPSDFTVPAQVCRGDFLLTVSTGGKSPAFSRQVRRELAARYGEEYASYLDLLAKMREQLKRELPGSDARGQFWEKAMNQGILDMIKQGKLDKAEAEIKNAIGSIGAES